MKLLFLPAIFWFWLAVTCSADWSNNLDYAHGWIAFALAAYFLWKRAAQSDISECPPGLRVVAVSVIWLCCIAVLPLELLRQTPVYWRLFHWAIFGCVALVTLASAVLAGGRPLFRSSIFSIVFLATAVPWPTAVEYPITMGSMHAIAAGLAEWLPLWGIPVERQGTVLVLENCSVGVEEACSGIRSLQSAFMIALAAGELFRLSLIARVVILLWSVFLAVAVNAGRTVMLVIAGHLEGSAGIESAHDSLGLLALLILAMGTFAAAWLVSRKDPVGTAENDFDSGVAATRKEFLSARMPGGVPALSVALLGFLLAHAWFLFHEFHLEGRVAASPALSVNSQSSVESSPLSPLLQEMLSPSMGVMLRGLTPEGEGIHGYHFFWDRTEADSEKFFHRPDVCMPGGGWEPAGQPFEVQTHGSEATWVALPFERSGQRGLLLWRALLNGKPMDFELGRSGTAQQRALLDLLLNGTRQFTFEVAAFLVPYQGEEAPVDSAKSMAEELFIIP